MNKALCRRGLESRFVTLMFGIIKADGALTYCNAGHNPPFVIGKSGVRRLERGRAGRRPAGVRAVRPGVRSSSSRATRSSSSATASRRR